VEEYLAALEAGHKPNRQEFLARHAAIAEPLAECLDGLDFIQTAAPRLQESAADEAAGPPTLGADLHPEGPLGDFRLVREVGRGGMGVVYEAVQISLGRRVALKVLPFAGALDTKQLQRFKNEAQAAAHLQHQNIVPVHYVGCERGVHFYAMQFIDGQTLARVIADLKSQIADLPKQADSKCLPPGAPATVSVDLRDLPKDPQSEMSNLQSEICNPQSAMTTTAAAALSTERSTKSPAFFRTVATLGVPAAEALEHAHQVGVVHRDIKPANLLLEPASPLSPKGERGGGEGARLWITDFGLARLGTDPGLTMTGDLLGTIRYMSPEQALAKRVPIDHRTDIYSLGVTLYELLTLEPAYNGKSREEVLRQIAFEEPRPPRRLNKSVAAELETIVLKAMAKNPEERYTTAQELADDLKRFLEDKPIRAKRPTLLQRAWKWARRHRPAVRAALVSAAVFLVLLAIGSTVSTLLIWQAQARTKKAYRAETKARGELQTNLYFRNVALTERDWSANRVGQAEELLDQCPEYLRAWEWHYLKRAFHHTPLTLHGHTRYIRTLAFSPDGRRLASASWDDSVKVWDASAPGERLTLRGVAKGFVGVAFSPDGLRLASAGWNHNDNVQLWDLLTGKLIRVFSGHTDYATSVAFSPDGHCLASSSNDKTVRVWDAVTGKELLSLPHADRVESVAFSPNGKHLASASLYGTVNVWNLSTGEEVLTLGGHSDAVHSVTFSRDGRRLASAGADRTVKIWDVTSGREVLSLCGHTGAVLSVAFSPDGRRLASASNDQTVRIWDATTGQEALTLWRGKKGCWGVAFSPDGLHLAATMETTVKVWDATPLEEEPGQQALLTLHAHTKGVTCVAFSRDGKYFASASRDRTVKIWDATTGEETLTFRGHTRAVKSVAFHPEGKRLASVVHNVRVWDAKTGQELLSPRREDKVFAEVTYSPDGKHLAAANLGKMVKVWDAATGHEVFILPHPNPGACVAISPDGKLLAADDWHETVKVWDLGTRQELFTLPGHTAGLTSLAFSPNSQRLASAGKDGTVSVWDVTNRRELFAIRAHGDVVTRVTFSPDGQRLASASGDRTVKLWNAATGERILILRGHSNAVSCVAFSPDGRRLASASEDGTIRVWDAALGKEKLGRAIVDPKK
jgi:WD40 repeat protein/serine/threonine protein kinase